MKLITIAENFSGSYECETATLIYLTRFSSLPSELWSCYKF